MKSIRLSNQEKIIIFALIAISVMAWFFTVRHSQSMGSDMTMAEEPIIPGLLLYLVMWTVMMIAMMFPAITPIVLLFSTVHEKRRVKNEGFVPTWVFVAGYLLVWAVFGVLAYFVDIMITRLAMNYPKLQPFGHFISGAVLIISGLYQLTPLKNICLTHCRSPLHFIMHKWREGYSGSLIMGIDHGAYCLGCCWGLMIVLFVVGIMNMSWMGILTLIIFVEKTGKHGVLISRFVGVSLIILGVVIIVRPEMFFYIL